MDSISNIFRSMIFAFSAGAFFFALAPHATAAPFIVGNNYSELAGRACGAAAFCDINTFTAVPAGKTLTLNRITCRHELATAGAVISSLWGGRHPAAISSVALVQFLAPIQSLGNGRHLVNADVNIVTPAGQKPGVRLTTHASATTSSVCTVAGTITP